MKRYVLIMFILLLIISPLSASDDTILYIEGLESLIDENNDQAKSAFDQLIIEYPDSAYKIKASNFLYNINNKVDNSGMVPFYLGNLSTLTYSSLRVLDLFDIEFDSLSIGLTGLTGVGLGLTTSYLLSKDNPISFDFYSNIITNQVIAMGNFYYLQGISLENELFEDEVIEEKAFLTAQLATLNGSLFLSYYALKDKEIKKGKAFFGLQAYSWTNYYYWLSTFLFDNLDTTNTLLIGMGLTDLSYYGSLKLWDKIEWSSARSGLVSIGGIGGALIGVFTNLILDDFVSINQKTYTSIIMGTTLTGQILASYFTRNIDKKSPSKVAINNVLTPYPIIKSNNEIGIGFISFI